MPRENNRSLYPPEAEIVATATNGLLDTKVNQRIKAIVNYVVVEKTKNYVILKCNGIYLLNNKRSF